MWSLSNWWFFSDTFSHLNDCCDMFAVVDTFLPLSCFNFFPSKYLFVLWKIQMTKKSLELTWFKVHWFQFENTANLSKLKMSENILYRERETNKKRFCLSKLNWKSRKKTMDVLSFKWLIDFILCTDCSFVIQLILHINIGSKWMHENYDLIEEKKYANQKHTHKPFASWKKIIKDVPIVLKIAINSALNAFV